MAVIVLCTINAKWIHPSFALRLLAANLSPEFHSVRILEFALRQPPEEKTAALMAEEPKILALSVSVWNHGATLELLRILEKKWSGGSRPVIVLGGPEITGLAGPPDPVDSPEEQSEGLAIFFYADFVVTGEGEAVFAELCRTVLNDPADAKKRYGKFIHAGRVNLSVIKNGYNFYTSEDLRQKLIYVESSRGCPYACAFCQSSRKPGTGESPVREFPLKPFLADLKNILQRAAGSEKTRTLKFLDRSFNVNLPRAMAILDFCLLNSIGEANVPNYKNGLQFHFEMVPSLFPVELRNMLARFPPESIRLEIGIQSLNPQTCSQIKRDSNPEEELEVLRFLRKNTNAILHVDLIAGLPGEDLDSFGRGFDRLWMALSGGGNNAGKNKMPFEIQPGILKILPGTPMYVMLKDGSFPAICSKTAPYEVIETRCLPVSDMEKIKNFARFWEIIVNRRAFPVLLSRIVPSGTPVFHRFMKLSKKFFDRFGKNWGIPKEELEAFLKEGVIQI
ncbi:MAG: radical SAM protein [Treponema sp.]|nr:radical SAM protein [Treponema sp.]